MSLKFASKSDQSDYEIDTPTLAALAVAANLDKVRDVKIVTGSRDVDVSLGDDDFDITGVTGIQRIRRAWFWISQFGQPTVGINTNQPVKLLFFAKDTFVHFINNVDPDNDGLVAELVEFHFVVQDFAATVAVDDKQITIDDTALYASGLLIRAAKLSGPTHEFQRIQTIDSATLLTVIGIGVGQGMRNIYALNDDVALVLEIGSFEYEDQDGTGEIHMRISPGDTGGDDFRLHWVIEYEAKQS